MSNWDRSAQRDRVVGYLRRHGRINAAEAMHELGIYRLAARVHELRHRGFEIETVEPGQGLAWYVLESEPETVEA